MAGVVEEHNSELNESSAEIAEDGVGEADEERAVACKLPLARVKRIMKADPDLNLASQDAVYLVTKATELFIESLVLEIYQNTTQSRRKTVTKRDLDSCIEAIDALAFLDGALE